MPHVTQRVIHPAHVPLERETEATAARWTAHAWPGG